MDNKQAASVLRRMAATRRTNPLDSSCLVRADAAERGADALEMLEWLDTINGANDMLHVKVNALWREWDGNGNFRAFCEARFEESKKHA